MVIILSILLTVSFIVNIFQYFKFKELKDEFIDILFKEDEDIKILRSLVKKQNEEYNELLEQYNTKETIVIEPVITTEDATQVVKPKRKSSKK